MKIDTSRLKKGTSEVPIECRHLIHLLSSCNQSELINELLKIDSWTFGKCELYHWITILDKFDQILEEATQHGKFVHKKENIVDKCEISLTEMEWSLKCDTNFSEEDVKLLLLVLNFTTLLIEHSFSRHLYNSIEHLTKLLSSKNMNIVLGVLNLLYMFSKRSNFISRLTNNKKNALLARLNFYAESWGGKEYGFSLAACCEKDNLPETASTFFYEFYVSNGITKTIEYSDITSQLGIHLNAEELTKKMFNIHKQDIKNLDEDKKVHMLIRVRRAWAFRNHDERLNFVQARLQALSVLIYSNAIQENIHQLLYPGFLEELVELMGLTDSCLIEIKAAALRTLTSIIHLDRNPHFPKKPGSRLVMIIDVTGASSYHGFLPTLVRTCINSLTSFKSTICQQQQFKLNQHSNLNDDFNKNSLYLRSYCLKNNFPLPLATALFSFLYHLASYESGGEALVSCGMMESLIRIINWNGYELEHITFVTRAVRVIDLITNIEMNSFQNYGGLESFINRLDLEINVCRQEQPFEIQPAQSNHVSSNSIIDFNDFTGFFANTSENFETNALEQNQERSSVNRSLNLTNSFGHENQVEQQSLQSENVTIESVVHQNQNPSVHRNLNVINEHNTQGINDSTISDSISSIRAQHQQQINQETYFIPVMNTVSNTPTFETFTDFNTILNEQNSCSNNETNKSSNSLRATTKTCLPQRAALLKSMLNFLKKAIQDQTFSESIRHLMEGTLPASLRHIISNAEYYGPSLFLLATDVVTVYVFQEPSLLSSLQDSGLTDVVLQALLKKDVPATREVLGSLPNVFSALCLNARGLQAFVKYAPFERLYKVLLSPVYLLAMRRRRSNEPMGDTASNLGNAMDELMRHQPCLRTEATKAIIKLLNELVHLGSDPKYICWRPTNKNDLQSVFFSNISSNSLNQLGVNSNDTQNSSLIQQQQQTQQHEISENVENIVIGASSNLNSNDADMSDGDDEDDDEEEASTSSHNIQRDDGPDSVSNQSSGATCHPNIQCSRQETITIQNTTNELMITEENEERENIPLIDYILNAMKFIDAILSNNSTDDHCKEFVLHGGLHPLLSILALPNLPVDSPVTTSAQAVAAVCKSILNLSHEPEVLQVGLDQLSTIVDKLNPLQIHIETPGGSVLLSELVSCCNINAAFSNATYTPLLHAMSAVHGYIVMLVHVCRTGQSEIRLILLEKWGQKKDLLAKLVQLYTALVWESTLLLALCTDEVLPSQSEFGQKDIEKLLNEHLISKNQQTNSNEFNSEEIDASPTVEKCEVENNAFEESTNTNSETDYQNNINKRKIISSSGQLKYIKALLGASSRLGRALAELFGNLVKLCVGSPLRQRRGQSYSPTPGYTSEEAKDIAKVLSYILVDGFSYEKLSSSPIPKLKLTFLICSIGFTGPMLFDEKRYAYHLMLYQFVEEGGLKAFFQMFEWALSPNTGDKGDFKQKQPDYEKKKEYTLKFLDGTGEFLDAWLMLLEKMVNPKAILESPHVINLNSIQSRSTQPIISSLAANRSGISSRNYTRTDEISETNQSSSFSDLNKKQKKKEEKIKKLTFDPILYLVTIHRLAFDAVNKIWGMKPLPVYGIRMTESIMSILKHILKSEKMIKEKYIKRISEIKEAKQLLTSKQVSESSEMLLASTASENNVNDNFSFVNTMSTQTGASTSNHNLDYVVNRIRLRHINSRPGTNIDSEVVVNQEYLRQLIDMGFSGEHATTALMLNETVQDATEYLLNHPSLPNSMPEIQQSTTHSNSFYPNSRRIQTPVEQMDFSDQESSNINRGKFTKHKYEKSSKFKANFNLKKKFGNKHKTLKEEKNKRRYQITTDPPLKKCRIDEFCDTSIEKTIFLMDELPETVSKGTDLLVILYRRNTQQWRHYFLMKIITELNNWINFIRKQIRLECNNVRVMLYGEGAQKFHVRLQLCCLLMDDIYPDMRESICCTINELNTLSFLLALLFETEELLRKKVLEMKAEHRRKTLLALSVIVINDDDYENDTKESNNSKKDIKIIKPKWLAQIITFIDLVEKVNLSIQRKKNMLNVTSRVWKWYDINLGRWNTYSVTNNKIIDQAYENGEASVPITSGRQRYTVNFNCMSQVNDESGNHRPVILSLKIVEKLLHPVSHKQQESQQNSSSLHNILASSVVTERAQHSSQPSTSMQSIPCLRNITTNRRLSQTSNFTSSFVNSATLPESNQPSTVEKPAGLPLILSSDDSDGNDCEKSEENFSIISSDEKDEYSSDNIEKNSCSSNAEDDLSQDLINFNNLKVTPPSAEGIFDDEGPLLPGLEKKFNIEKVKQQTFENYQTKNPVDIKIDTSPVGLYQFDTGEIISCLVRLLHPQIDADRDTFLAIMKLCVRLTKDFKNAKIFAEKGGVRLLLQMRQTCGHMGFPIFATLLIRHVLEEPKTLALAMEKVIAARTMPTIPPGYRDLLFLLRQMSSAVSRDPRIFCEVAKKILRIDLLSPRLVKQDDSRFLVKSIVPSSTSYQNSNIRGNLKSLSGPSSSVSNTGSVSNTSNTQTCHKYWTSGKNGNDVVLDKVSIEALHDLLKALVQPSSDSVEMKCNLKKNLGFPILCQSRQRSSSSQNQRTNRVIIPTSQNVPYSSNENANNVNVPNESQQTFAQDQTITEHQSSQFLQNEKCNTIYDCNEFCRCWHLSNQPQADKPLLPRATILKFLADAVRSYPLFASVIVEYFYTPEDSILIKSPQSFISYILDKFLPLNEHASDREVSSMTRVLIASLASCSEHINVQTTIVYEVKLAIDRLLMQNESIDKHSHLQTLVGLIPTMIENCPSENNALLKLHQFTPRGNEIFYMMVRKGLISDLAKLTQYLDLSSPYTISTVNATLKPLETLLRMTNAPGPDYVNQKKNCNRRINQTSEEQPDVEEPANYLSQSSETISRNNGRVNNLRNAERFNMSNNQNIMEENPQEFQSVAENLVRRPERGQSRLDDIMDQLLVHASNIETTNVNSLDNNSSVRRVVHDFFDESSTESGESESNGSDNEREVEDDEDNEEELEDRSEIDVDEETRQYIEIYDHVYNNHTITEDSSNTIDSGNHQEVINNREINNRENQIDNNTISENRTPHHIELTSQLDSNIIPIQNDSVDNITINQSREDEQNPSSLSSIFYSQDQRSSSNMMTEFNNSTQLNTCGINVDDFDEILSIDSTDIGPNSSSMGPSARVSERFGPRHHQEVVAESVVADVVANVVAAIENSERENSHNLGVAGVEGEENVMNNRVSIESQNINVHVSQSSQNLRRRRRRPIHFSFAINSPLVPMSDFINLRRRRYTILNENVDHTPIILQQLLGSANSGLVNTNNRSNALSENVNNTGRVSGGNSARNISISTAMNNLETDGVVDTIRSCNERSHTGDNLSLNPHSSNTLQQNENSSTNITIGNSSSGNELRNLNSSSSNIFRDATRVVLMDNAFGVFPDEHFPDDRSIDLVDQAGYLFGQTLAATLASTPTALHWWLEESKNLGLESQSDICLIVGHHLLPILEEQRELELTKLRNKKKRRENMSKNVPAFNNIDSKQLSEIRTEESDNDQISDVFSLTSQPGISLTVPQDNADSTLPNFSRLDITENDRVEIQQSEESLNPNSVTANTSSLENSNSEIHQLQINRELNVNEREHSMITTVSFPSSSSDCEIYTNLNSTQQVNLDLSNKRNELSISNSIYRMGQDKMENQISENSQISDKSFIEISPEVVPHSSVSIDHKVENTHEDINKITVEENNEEHPYSSIQEETQKTVYNDNTVNKDEIANRNMNIEINVTDYEMKSSTSVLNCENEVVDDVVKSSDNNLKSFTPGLSTNDTHAKVNKNDDLDDIFNKINSMKETDNSCEKNLLGESATRVEVVFNSNDSLHQVTSDVTSFDIQKDFIITEQNSEEIIEHMGSDSKNISDMASSSYDANKSNYEIQEIISNSNNLERITENCGAVALTNNDRDNNEEIQKVLGDLEVPEGVDPSFLAALPQEMREEVLAEHLRLQRLRQRAQQISIQVEHAAVAEVNPEFLAALPPNIQEEVLAQQRIELQRQAAAQTNPNDPVDAAAFFQNLPSNLRQAILTDMEESQISVLPPDLAEEAQTLRRDWENRNRQIMHERLINQISSNTSSAGNVLNLYRNPRFPFVHNVRLAQNWQTGDSRANVNPASGGGGVTIMGNQGNLNDISNASPSLMAIMERQGKPLLDHEALSSLLILLFIDDPKFNTLRLHRVIRNLCCHVSTREWIINTLLSVITKTNESFYIGNIKTEDKSEIKPNWLNIRSDAALGSRANVFSIEYLSTYDELYDIKNINSKKQFSEWLAITQDDSEITNSISMYQNYKNNLCNTKRTKKNTNIKEQNRIEINNIDLGIHPQTAYIVCKHAFELLITLAKSFPKNFVPCRKNNLFSNKETVENQHSQKHDINLSKNKEKLAPLNGSLNLKLINKSNISLANPTGTLNISSNESHLTAFYNTGRLSLNSYLALTSIDIKIDFWEIVLSLDRNKPFKKPTLNYAAKTSTQTNKNYTFCTSNIQQNNNKQNQYNVSYNNQKDNFINSISSNINSMTFDQSPFGILVSMLSYRIVNKSNSLTDKLLRLLSYISVVFPNTKPIQISPQQINQSDNQTSQDQNDSLGGTKSQITQNISNGQKINEKNIYFDISKEAENIQHQNCLFYNHIQERKMTKSFSKLIDDASILPTDVNLEKQNNIDLNKLYDIRLPIPERLALIVETLIEKKCSEEGLEDATTVLLNLSLFCRDTRMIIFRLLIDATNILGKRVRKQILCLLNELYEMDLVQIQNNNQSLQLLNGSNLHISNDISLSKSGETSPHQDSMKIKQDLSNYSGTSTINIIGAKPKGILQDRFTSETVIINAPTKTKQSSELQLASMVPLISRTSTQAIFLKILKTIIQIRDSVVDEHIKYIENSIIEPNKNSTPEKKENQNLNNEASNLQNDEGKKENRHCYNDIKQHFFNLYEMSPLSKLLQLDELWVTLSNCLIELELSADYHAVLVLQSAVEAFFLVHATPQKNSLQTVSSNYTQRENENSNLTLRIDTSSSEINIENNPNESKNSASILQDKINCSSSLAQFPELEDFNLNQSLNFKQSADQKKFLQFAEKHRSVLNQILRQTTVHLSDGPFAVLVDHTRILDFDVKRRYFRTELERLDEGIRREEIAVHVNRKTVFEDSFRELYRRNAEEWKNRFYIVFEDEEGQDAGGLLREWYVIISREIFNPMYALFTVSPGDRVTYMINSSSHANPNHLCYYKFVGRVIAKAIYDNKLLECYFTRSFYKHILGIQVKYTDMESEDYEFYKSLIFLLENEVSALGYDLTFSLEVQEFGVTEIKDLIPNGRNIFVTDDNKLEYIRLVCQLKMSNSIKQQLNAFLEGFYDIIPKRLISIFNEQELELLISGLPNVDIEDLRVNTEYHKYQINSIQIQWFWRALRSFDQAERAKFLQFVTGTSKVPLNGFGSLEGMNGIQKFQIHRDDRSTDRLPSAHTCFNQLDLPVYKTYDKLRSSLLKAIHECSEGFGFA